MFQDNYIFSGAKPEEVWPLIREYHYSARMPANIQHCYSVRKIGGLFGDTGEPVAAIIFSLTQAKWSEELLELSRLVRHPDYKEPLTKLISFSCSWLRKSKWNLVISYADWTHKHHGGIYQASSWNYHGKRERSLDGLIINGKMIPGRSCNAQFGTRSPSRLSAIREDLDIRGHYDEGKYLYWKPLTVSGRIQAKRLCLNSLPYPKPNEAIPMVQADVVGQV